jgi:hypothetical protein
MRFLNEKETPRFSKLLNFLERMVTVQDYNVRFPFILFTYFHRDGTTPLVPTHQPNYASGAGHKISCQKWFRDY